MSFDDSLFDRAKAAADIEDVAGGGLVKSGAGKMRGPCPIGGCGKGSKWNGPFVIDLKDKWFKCWSCDAKGDVIELEHILRGRGEETPADAARRILEEDPLRRATKPAKRPATKVFVPDDGKRGWTADMAVRLWREGQPAAGTYVERYLRSRNFRGQVLDDALKRLRFHPMAFHSRVDRDILAFPAMLGIVHAPAGATGGIHATYLRHDGRGKAAVPEGMSAKIMLGPQARDGVYGCVWLTHPTAPGPLVVSEGIESGGSLAILEDRQCRVAATLALNRLQGGWLETRDRTRDPACPRPDPAYPAFTWPEAPVAPWGEVLIAIDHDMKRSKVKVRGPQGRVVDHMMDSSERANVCAALSSHWWRETTTATVRPMLPPVGQDWSDVLRERSL